MLRVQESGRQWLPFAQAKFELKWGGGDGEGGLGARYVECLCVTEREGEREYCVVLKAIYSTERKGKEKPWFFLSAPINQERNLREEKGKRIFFPPLQMCHVFTPMSQRRSCLNPGIREELMVSFRGSRQRKDPFALQWTMSTLWIITLVITLNEGESFFIASMSELAKVSSDAQKPCSPRHPVCSHRERAVFLSATNAYVDASLSAAARMFGWYVAWIFTVIHIYATPDTIVTAQRRWWKQ